jgi:Hemerythrin HHE cation binding domain
MTSESLVAQIAGSLQAAKARVEGLTGVFRKLAQEHGELSALMLRVSRSRDVALRERLLPTIRQQLLSHERGEIEVVYAALEEPLETQGIVAQHRQEVVELDKMLEQLCNLECADPAWASAFAALTECVQRHAAEEEQEFFPTAQRVLGGATARELSLRYHAIKEGYSQR